MSCARVRRQRPERRSNIWHSVQIIQNKKRRDDSEQMPTSWLRCSVFTAYGCGSKPMVPVWGRCTTHFSLFCWEWDVHWGYLDFGPWPANTSAFRQPASVAPVLQAENLHLLPEATAAGLRAIGKTCDVWWEVLPGLVDAVHLGMNFNKGPFGGHSSGEDSCPPFTFEVVPYEMSWPFMPYFQPCWRASFVKINVSPPGGWP